MRALGCRSWVTVGLQVNDLSSIVEEKFATLTEEKGDPLEVPYALMSATPRLIVSVMHRNVF